jgi:uncharacterized protein GlcG (DUF336 family)
MAIPARRDAVPVRTVGVSGNTPQEDEDIARAGAAALKYHGTRSV